MINSIVDYKSHIVSITDKKYIVHNTTCEQFINQYGNTCSCNNYKFKLDDLNAEKFNIFLEEQHCNEIYVFDVTATQQFSADDPFGFNKKMILVSACII